MANVINVQSEVMSMKRRKKTKPKKKKIGDVGLWVLAQATLGWLVPGLAYAKYSITDAVLYTLFAWAIGVIGIFTICLLPAYVLAVLYPIYMLFKNEGVIG